MAPSKGPLKKPNAPKVEP